MRILIVANHNTGRFAPFVTEQVKAIRDKGEDVDFYGVHGYGITGYLSNIGALKAKIREYQPQVIHAHYGLSGLLANLQRSVPVITTYHGSDIHSKGLNLILSKMCMRLSAYNIFVTRHLQKQAGYHGSNQCVQPCGIDTKTIFAMDCNEARKQLGWSLETKYVLFSSAFDNAVKNSALAKAAVDKLHAVQLVEMKGFTRQQVNLALNAANCILMTSHREGSPQVIKEAMACGTPIVTVNVGDVKERLDGLDGCYVSQERSVDELANALSRILTSVGRTAGRDRIFSDGLDNSQIADKIISIYKQCLQ